MNTSSQSRIDHSQRIAVTPAAGGLCFKIMRFLLALLAIVGLLASPVAAAAAQATCQEHGGAMSMAMADMAQAGHAADPCCDPGKAPQPSKHNDMSCMLSCMAMCGVVAALPETQSVALEQPQHETLYPSRMASLTPHAPGRLERPPRSII